MHTTEDLHAHHAPPEPREEPGWVQLYLCQPPPNPCSDTSPPIRLDLITERAIKGLLALLAVFFPEPKTRRRIRVEWGGAWLEVRQSLFPSLLADTKDLVEIIPELNEWLTDWATSDDRRADHEPAWAQRRAISEVCVLQIAKLVVKHLASSSWRRIRVADDTGTAELKVPPKPQLVAPEAASRNDVEIFRVDDKQPVTKYVTRNGQVVISSHPSTDSEDSVEIDFRGVHQISITSASRLLSIPESEDEEESV